MPDRFHRGEIVELLYELEHAAILSVIHPIAAYVHKPLRITIPEGAQGVVEKSRKGEVYLLFLASDDIEVKRWVQTRYVRRVRLKGA